MGIWERKIAVNFVLKCIQIQLNVKHYIVSTCAFHTESLTSVNVIEKDSNKSRNINVLFT